MDETKQTNFDQLKNRSETEIVAEFLKYDRASDLMKMLHLTNQVRKIMDGQFINAIPWLMNGQPPEIENKKVLWCGLLVLVKKVMQELTATLAKSYEAEFLPTSPEAEGLGSQQFTQLLEVDPINLRFDIRSPDNRIFSFLDISIAKDKGITLFVQHKHLKRHESAQLVQHALISALT